jgi:hypothetical protein
LLYSCLQTELTAYEKFPEPREMDVTLVLPNKQKVGRAVQARVMSHDAHTDRQ